MKDATDNLDNIRLYFDGHRYWLTMNSEAGQVSLSLSNMYELNPDRIKLEAWAKEQLSKAEDSN